MKPLTLGQIASAVGGTLIAGTDEATINRVCTDSRAMHAGCLFIALKGDNFDAHDHLDKAAAGGATAVMIDRDIPTALPAIHVDNTRIAMGRLANHVRHGLDKTRIIAIAGSNGKTGTKHLIHSVLSTKFSGTMSPKSFNNDVGVPLTLFGVEPNDNFVVVEVGTNHPGEVKHLSLMCEPDIAVVTSIGEEHMEFFKDLDGVRRENADIIAGLRSGGEIFITGDDSRLRVFMPTVPTFGFSKTNDLIATEILSTLDGTSFVVATPESLSQPIASADIAITFNLPQIGRHNASNALAAIAIGRHFGLTDDQIRTGLATATAPYMRMQKRSIGPVTVINDAYNANPTSVRAALNTLEEIDWPGRKIAVLGEMRELGHTASAAHRAIVDWVRSSKLNETFFIGDSYSFTQSHSPDHWFPDSVSAGVIAAALQPNDLILIKASRSIRLEKVEAAITARFA